MRWLLLTALCPLCMGCPSTRLSAAPGAISVQPDHLDFGLVPVGAHIERSLRLTNAGGLAQVRVSIAPPFSVITTGLQLPPSSELELVVAFTATNAGNFEAVLGIDDGTASTTAWVQGRAEATLACEPATSCHRAEFDDAQNRCTQVPRPDGVPCEDVCLREARCAAGSCVGQPRSCDDQDACTTDSCAPGVGCTSTPVVCPPPANPCLVARCEISHGCGTTPVEDGTPCGPQTCATAQVCITGICAQRPRPDAAGCGTQLAVGPYHSCVGHPTGGVSCWGVNDDGQLGDGTTTSSPTPVSVADLHESVRSISVSKTFSCAVTEAGAALCWGDNSFGQLGDGTTQRHLTPRPVAFLSSGVVSLSTGTHHACAVLSGGRLMCWGSNAQGELGTVTSGLISTVPVEVPALPAASVTAGDALTCIVGVRVVWGWGAEVSDLPQCWGATQVSGHAESLDIAAIQLGGDVSAIALRSGSDAAAFFVLNDGTVKAFDLSPWSAHAAVMVDVPDLPSGVQQVSAAGWFAWALTDSGELTGWSALSPTRTHLATTGPVASVGVGPSHACLVRRDGVVACWGGNYTGQLGVGLSVSSSATPLVVHF